jgi:pyruvate dehydrogenase E2 component (dihydrolipoamide acetyltransferase)
VSEIKMIALLEGMVEGTVGKWLKHDGDEVAPGDAIAEIETDKVTVECVADTGGFLETVVAEGTAVAVGDVIARVADGSPTKDKVVAGAHVEQEAPQGVTRETTSATIPLPRRTPDRNGDSVRGTPLAQRIARQQGIDLVTIEGTGPRGLVTRKDVSTGIIAALDSPDRLRPRPTDDIAARTQDMTRLQKVVAERMSTAKATIPDFRVEIEVAVDKLLALRAEAKDLPQPRPTPSINDFIVKAVALALREHPQVNAAYEGGRFVYHEHINVGIAVAGEGTLVVPVVRNADQRSLGEIAAETLRLAETVRTNAIDPEDLAGGTFTISNLGMLGVTSLTPIINLGQAAILGVGAVRESVVLDGETVRQRHLLTVSLTCDHRILYGADAARFLSTVRGILEHPVSLLLV